jgi:hypothetical protein
MSHAPSPFALVLFPTESALSPGLTSESSPPIYVSHVAVITGMGHHKGPLFCSLFLFSDNQPLVVGMSLEDCFCPCNFSVLWIFVV